MLPHHLQREPHVRDLRHTFELQVVALAQLPSLFLLAAH
jgi:hypothetical protein